MTAGSESGYSIKMLIFHRVREDDISRNRKTKLILPIIMLNNCSILVLAYDSYSKCFSFLINNSKLVLFSSNDVLHFGLYIYFIQSYTLVSIH